MNRLVGVGLVSFASGLVLGQTLVDRGISHDESTSSSSSSAAVHTQGAGAPRPASDWKVRRQWAKRRGATELTEADVLEGVRVCTDRNYGMLVTQHAAEALGGAGTSSETEATARVVDANVSRGDDLNIWLATRRTTRKVQHLWASPRASFVFDDSRNGNGYACMVGLVEEVTAAEERRARWKDTWWLFHPKGPDDADVAVFRFVPHRIEVVCNERGIAPSWQPAVLHRSQQHPRGWQLKAPL